MEYDLNLGPLEKKIMNPALKSLVSISALHTVTLVARSDLNHTVPSETG